MLLPRTDPKRSLAPVVWQPLNRLAPPRLASILRRESEKVSFDMVTSLIMSPLLVTIACLHAECRAETQRHLEIRAFQ